MAHYIKLDEELRMVLNAVDTIARTLLLGIWTQIGNLVERAWWIRSEVRLHLKDDHPQGWNKQRIEDELAEFAARGEALYQLLAWLCGEKEKYDEYKRTTTSQLQHGDSRRQTE